MQSFIIGYVNNTRACVEGVNMTDSSKSLVAVDYPVQVASGITAIATDERLVVVLVLDKSGSMSGIRDDMIRSFNELLDAMKNEPRADDIRFVLVPFSTTVDSDIHLHRVKSVEPLSRETYVCDGETALFDAIGGAIRAVESAQKKRSHYRHVLVFIFTDGGENHSRKWNADSLLPLIEEKKELGWKFIFFGADEAALRSARSVGLGAHSVSVPHTSVGTRQAAGTMMGSVTMSLNPNWEDPDPSSKP